VKARWQSRPLDSLVTHDSPITYGVVKPGDEGEVPFVRGGDVADGLVRIDQLRTITTTVSQQYKRTLLRGGELLISLVGQPGQVAVATPTLAGANIARQVGLIRLQDDVDAHFVSYFLRSPDGIAGLGKFTGGSVQQVINLSDLRQVPVPLPPLDEQRRIVTLLDEAFADIATAKANAEKNLQNARKLFESHLQAIFSKRGTNWEDKTLEQISTIFGRGKSRHRPRNDPSLYGGKYPFVQTGDVRNAEHIITEFSQTYSEAGLAQSKLWPKGTICITIAANIAETGILGFDACFPDSVIGVVPNPDEAEVGYVEYVLQSFKARLQALGQGSAQANINMGTFENERFPFPKVEEQRRIVAKLDALSEESQRLESIYRQKLTALDDLKKSLLHQAFSGQL